MIIENEEKCLSKALELSTGLTGLAKLTLNTTDLSDDPREIVFIALHAIGNFLARMIIVLEGYSHTYEGESVTHESIKAAINDICDKYIKLNTKLIK